tara:strand:- start:760 stop:918 length:159 start_codon:yes stop_codon:yes gene_type:complete
MKKILLVVFLWVIAVSFWITSFFVIDMTTFLLLSLASVISIGIGFYLVLTDY